MKKKILISCGVAATIAIVLIISIVSIKNNKKEIALEKVWELSYGREITSDLYEDEGNNRDLYYSSNVFMSISLAQEGYIIVGKNKYETSNIFSDEQGIIEYYDFDGNVKWSALYPKVDLNGYDIQSTFTGVLAVSDGYIVVGREVAYNGTDIVPSMYENGIILKYDLKGNLLWNKKYQNPSDTEEYTFSEIIELNNKYYIIGELNNHSAGRKDKGIVIELDSNGNQNSINKYDEIDYFYSANLVNDSIIISYRNGNEKALVRFNNNNFEEVFKYGKYDNSEIIVGEFSEFEYLDGIYYLIDPSMPGNILAVDDEGNKKFNNLATKGDELYNYFFTDIVKDDENIYVYAQYEDPFETLYPNDSAIIVFDKEGNYQIINIGTARYEKIIFHNNSLLLVGRENSFAKYKIRK